jgi:hypothetical protein
VSQVYKECKEKKDLLGSAVLRASKAPAETRVCKESKVLRVFKVFKENKAQLVCRDL